MKKILLIVMALAFTFGTAQAQNTKQVNHTITNADTVTFSRVPDNVIAFAYALTKTSGAVAGKVYLEGGIIEGQWNLIDSLTLADVTTIQSKTFPISSTSNLNYRFRCTNTSSATAEVKGAYLRR